MTFAMLCVSDSAVSVFKPHMNDLILPRTNTWKIGIVAYEFCCFLIVMTLVCCDYLT